MKARSKRTVPTSKVLSHAALARILGGLSPRSELLAAYDHDSSLEPTPAQEDKTSGWGIIRNL